MRVDEPAPEPTESGLDEFLFSGHSIQFQFGGDFAFDSDIKNQSTSPVGIRNGRISFDPGFDFLFTWGIPVWEQLSLEISTGFSYNSVKSVDGSWAPVQLPVTGGNGNVNGVPLVIGLGAYVRYSGTTQANFGPLGFGSPGAGSGPDLTLTDLSALAVGLNLYINF